jgi:hypothetical protein
MIDAAEKRRRAEAASRLANDDVLQLAFDKARVDALEQLATVAAEPTLVIALQQRVKAIDEIRKALEAMILAAPSGPKRVI